MPKDIVTLVVNYLAQAKDWLITSGLRIALVILLFLIASLAARVATSTIFSRLKRGKDGEYAKRVDTLRDIASFSIRIVLVSITLFIVLGQVGVNLGPILAAAGVFGLAVGFGAQALVQDVISGFFLLLEDQIRVGDVVQIGDKGGLVEKVTLRMIILRDLAGNAHFIRNGQISVVTNMTKDYSRYVFDIGVAYREDVDEVIEIIKQVDAEMREDEQWNKEILEPIEILGLDKFADSAVIIKARNKTRPVMQWSVGREFNRRLKKRFDELGVEIPFPHRTVYFGEDKRGQAPAMRVARADRHQPREKASPAAEQADGATSRTPGLMEVDD